VNSIRVALDTKNLALYAGGIAAFIRPLFQSWVGSRPKIQFVLVGPSWESRALTDLPNCERHIVAWPKFLPRPLRHPFYDNVLFPRAVRRVQPDFVFSPYHDVRFPVGVPSVMMIHDTCLGDFPEVYPRRVRTYYQTMLRVNLARVRHVLTVSETSRACILARHRLDPQHVSVVPNTLEPEFLTASDDVAQVAEIRARQSGGMRLFYPSGGEFRKNVGRLMGALGVLVSRGANPHLWATGGRDAGWDRGLVRVPAEVLACLHFVGTLSLAELRAHYLAADTVVYPSLCEGFGRVCLEAMEVGAPIACSDLPVLREVAGDYPTYFDPLNVGNMADRIAASAAQGRRQARHEPRFEREAVASLFVTTMDRILVRECGHA
jgi:glycosyltransferase involved in cell wall biosynthesis